MASPTPYTPAESAFECPVLILPGAVAGQDLSAFQFCFVKIDATNQTIVPCVAADSGIGVLQEKPKDQQGASVMTIGVSKVIAGAAVPAGSRVQSDASSHAIVATGTNPVLGVALQAAAALGDIIPILVKVP
jgi:hypothetical protein